MAIIIVSIEDSQETWSKDLLSDIVLQNTFTRVAVQAKGVTYLESFGPDGEELEEGDPGYLEDVYQEWLEMAQTGEEGFSLVTVSNEHIAARAMDAAFASLTRELQSVGVGVTDENLLRGLLEDKLPEIVAAWMSQDVEWNQGVPGQLLDVLGDDVLNAVSSMQEED